MAVFDKVKQLLCVNRKAILVIRTTEQEAAHAGIEGMRQGPLSFDIVNLKLQKHRLETFEAPPGAGQLANA